MSLNEYEYHFSNTVKSQIVLDFIMNKPHLAQEAFKRYILNDDPEQKTMKTFCQMFKNSSCGDFMLDGTNEHLKNELLKEEKHKKFFPCIHNELLLSFKTVLINDTYLTDYKKLLEQYDKINFNDALHLNELIDLVGYIGKYHNVEEKDKLKIQWLKDIIEFKKDNFHTNAITLNNHNIEILKHYFNDFDNETKLAYIISSDIYEHIKDKLETTFFNDLAQMNFFLNDRRDTNQIKKSIVSIVLNDDILCIDILKDYINDLNSCENKDQFNLFKIQIKQNLIDHSRKLTESLYNLNEIKKEKYEFLESKLNISIVSLFERCPLEVFFNLFLGSDFELHEILPLNLHEKLNQVLNYFIEKNTNNLSIFDFNAKEDMYEHLKGYYYLCLIFSFENPNELPILNNLVSLSTLNEPNSINKIGTSLTIVNKNEYPLLNKLIAYFECYQKDLLEWFREDDMKDIIKKAPALLEKLIIEQNQLSPLNKKESTKIKI
jgi:hypothetical protein